MPHPTITDLYAELNALLFPDAAPSTTDSNARDTLARAIAEIKNLRQRVADTTWRQVADEPPPLHIDLLFWRGGSFWVGRVEEVTVHDSESGAECLEVAYYCDGDYDDGDPPTAWCFIPAGDGEDEDGEQGEE